MSFQASRFTSWPIGIRISCQNPTGLDFQAKIFFKAATPLFVIGDVEPHGIGDVVNFWGSQWWKNNQMSVTTRSQAIAVVQRVRVERRQLLRRCVEHAAGQQLAPPETIPANFVIIVTSKVLKNGNVLSGDIKQIVVVHQDGNYQDNPGIPGAVR